MGNTTHIRGNSAASLAALIYGKSGGSTLPAKYVYVKNGGVVKGIYSVLTPSGTTPIGATGSGASGSGTPTVAGANVSASGNIGSLGYSWAYKSGDTSIAIAGGGATSNPTFSRAISGVPNGSTSSTFSAVWTCTIIDGDTGASITIDVTVNLAWTNTIPAYSGRVTDYDGTISADVSGTDTIDTNASQLIIEVWGGGGSGQRNNNACFAVHGGASGSYSRSVFSLSPSDWGKTINYLAGKAAPVVNSGNSTGFDGNTSTVNGNTYSMVGMSAPGGTGGGTALQGAGSGGNAANSQGNLGGTPAGGTAVAAVSGAGSGNGGAGKAGPTGTSFQGAPGRVRFTYSP